MTAREKRRRAKGGRAVLKGHYCLYCGVVADSLDHWPPVAMGQRAPGGFMLPACRECNRLVGDTPGDLVARIDHVRAALSRRYAKALKAPTWEPEELDELGPAMRAAMVAAMEERGKVQARLAWDSFRYLAMIR